MRIAAILLLLLGVLLIAIGRHRVRAARKFRLRTQNSALRTSFTGWTLTLLGFLAILLGVTLW